MAGAWIILKTGSTLPAIAQRRGDFEDWIRDGLQLAPAEVEVISVAEGHPLPSCERVRAAVVTGSSAMVTSREPWSVRSATWLRELHERGRPVLGICYGHQLLADALGGEVAKSPSGREIGTIEVRLTEAGRHDPLLGVVDDPFFAQTTHAEAIVRLPPGARVLASNAATAYQAFSLGNSWGLQFHPEFDADVVRGYVLDKRPLLRSEGTDPEAIELGIRDSDAGPRLLKRFREIVGDMG
ncbi:MAG: glutamine amidotransferase [Myxococcota bacterium]